MNAPPGTGAAAPGPLARPPALAHLVHRGSVLAAAFLVDAARIGRTEAVRRVLALWESGAVVQRVDGGWLVRLARPRRVRVEHAPGLPFVAEGALLVAAPLGAADLARRAAPDGALVRLCGGELDVVVPRSTDVEDVARWLDLSAYAPLDGAPLGAPAPAPTVAAAGTVPAAVRSMFGHAVAAPPKDLGRVLAALAKMQARGGAAAAGGAAPPAARRETPPSAGPRLGAWLRRFTAALAAFLTRILPAPKARAPASSRARSRPAPAASTSRGLAVRDAAPRGPDLLSRLLTRMHDLFARALLETRLAEYLGRRQAEYLGRMMEMFEQGDLGEALRHAIPLGGEGGAASPALGLPSPRGALDIRPEEAASASSLLLGGDLFTDLRRIYRSAFERLDAEGRVDEAAFVLAELLRVHEEAVSYLERHDRLRLAAEIAEARGLPAGLVVRQWFLAGQRARAVALARKTGSFADAVQRLEKAGSPAAEPLRLLWAETLAGAGDFAAAVDVAWPVEAARALARSWIDRAIEQGGVAGAGLLARKLELSPGEFAELWAASAALLDADHDGAGEERKAFARKLLDGATPQTRAVAVPTARALIRDASEARGGDGALVRELVPSALDAALRADVPANFGEPAASPAAALGDVAVAAHDAGSLPILDAVALPRGRFLVALGEGGVSVLGPDGRRIAHFDEPAHALVPSDRRDRAIAIARRGEAVRLGRIDVVGRRSEPWTEARLVAWAPDFDGAEWVVATERAVLRIDVTLARLEALDAVARDVGRVLAVSRSPARCSFAVALGTDAEPRGTERWRYDLPGWTLRAKNQLAGSAPRRLGLSSDGACGALRISRGADRSPELVLDLAGDGAHKEHALGPPDVAARRVVVEGRWAVVEVEVDAGVVLNIVDQHALRATGTLTLTGARTTALRLTADRLLVADDRGRLLLVDLARGAIVANLRI